MNAFWWVVLGVFLIGTEAGHVIIKIGIGVALLFALLSWIGAGGAAWLSAL